MEKFRKFIGIDYSGAKHSLSALPGIRVFVSEGGEEPLQIRVDEVSNKHWSRRALALWMVDIVSTAEEPLIIGIDHGFSFPEIYFEKYKIPRDWSAFLEDFVKFWPTTVAGNKVSETLEINRSGKNGRTGDSKWRRLTEEKSKGAKSVFHFSVPGSVASSTHAGISWIHFLRHHPEVSKKLHFWPFDGWIPAKGKSVIAEVYPALWSNNFVRTTKTQDEHDAYSIAKALSTEFSNNGLQMWFDPTNWKHIRLSTEEIKKVTYEGWILGLH